MAGNNYATQKETDVPSYASLIYQEIKVVISAPKKSSTSASDSAAIMDEIAQVNKKKSKRLQFLVTGGSIILMFGILMLPPNEPKLF